MLRGEKPKITFKKRVARGLLLWKLRLLPKNASPKGHNPPVLFQIQVHHKIECLNLTDSQSSTTPFCGKKTPFCDNQDEA
jgi:hypothetical protein